MAAWLGALLVVLVAAVGTVVWYRSSEQRKEEQAAELRLRATAARDQLSAFAKATGASMEWERNISTIRFTVDSERLWITGDSILFVGNVVDVSSADQQHYLVDVEYRARWGVLFLSKKFRLQVVCQKEKVEHVLRGVEGLKIQVAPAGVAVAARVERVRRTRSEVGFDDVFTGIGTCIDIVYVSNLSLLDRQAF